MARMADPKPETFAALLERLAKERKLSSVGHESWDTGVRGTSAATLRKIREKKRLPNPPIIEAVAAFVGSKPASFSEYELAKGRRALEEAVRLLDENGRGLDAALDSLAQLRPSLTQLEDAVAPAVRGQAPQRLGSLASKRRGHRQSQNRQEQDARADSDQ